MLKSMLHLPRTPLGKLSQCVVSLSKNLILAEAQTTSQQFSNMMTRVPGRWCRLAKTLGNQNIGGQRVVIIDESTGVAQLLGVRARAAPQSLRLCPRGQGYNSLAYERVPMLYLHAPKNHIL